MDSLSPSLKHAHLRAGLAPLSPIQGGWFWDDDCLRAFGALLQHGHRLGFGISREFIHLGFALESLLQRLEHSKLSSTDPVCGQLIWLEREREREREREGGGGRGKRGRGIKKKSDTDRERQRERHTEGSFQQQGCGLMGRTCNFRIDINALFSFLISNMMFEIGEFMLS